MSQYYSQKRTKGLFDPSVQEPFKLSRSKIDLFMKCPRCFYLDRRLGIGQPPSFPFTLNSAVDTLLKKEFDIYRAKGEPHPWMKTFGIDAVPFRHAKLEEWRDARSRGIAFLHEPSNFIVSGGIDDVWINTAGELLIVDYKATSKNEEVNLNADWQIAYKRQVEIYQWLFRRNGFNVAPTAYFVYCNGLADKEIFGGKLEFDVRILPYGGSDGWIEQALLDARACLSAAAIPKAEADCDFCRYYEAVRRAEEKAAPVV